MRTWHTPLLLLLLLPIAAAGGDALSANVSVKIRAPSGPQPFIIATLPADGSTVNTATPQLQAIFNVDMDTTRTDITRVVLPPGLTVTQLVWANPTTLNILYAGALPNFGAKRVDFLDRYFVTPGSMFIPLGSGWAFNYADPAGGGPNNPPTIISVNFSANPGGLNAPVVFNAVATDPDGDAVTFSWNFGDTTGTQGNDVSHLYTAPGDYTVTLMATDSSGAVVQTTRTLTIIDSGPAPLMISSTPEDGSTINSASPSLSATFNVDMDTSRIDTSKVVLPEGLIITQLSWTDPRTLRISYEGALDDFGAKRVDLMDGYFVNTVGEWIPFGSGFAFEYRNPNDKPFIVSNPTANPTAAVPGQPVEFNVLAFDPNGDALTYTWDFGDGTIGTGPNPTHTYAAPGPFLATVTVFDGNESVMAAVLVTGAVTAPWTVTKVRIGLNFKKTGVDKIQVFGVADLLPGFDPTGKRVLVDAGGAAQSFTMDKRGNAKTGKDKFKLKRKLKKKQFLGGAVKIQFMLRGTFVNLLADEGLTNDNMPKTGAVRSIEIVLTLDGQPYLAQVPLTYKAKAGKNGKAIQRTAVK